MNIGRAAMELVAKLEAMRHAGWTAWEEKFLQDVQRQPYELTEAQREKLDQLEWLSQPISSHCGVPIKHMVETCYRYRFDFDEADVDLLVQLHERGATSVPRRQARWLTRLCRESGEPIEDVA